MRTQEFYECRGCGLIMEYKKDGKVKKYYEE
jgi:hypothetical protein